MSSAPIAEIGGIVRTILSAFAGYAAGKGWVDNDTGLAIAGAVGTLVVAVWSVIQKRSVM